jgi:transcription-repair coupling factor (superfamily II helicase)
MFYDEMNTIFDYFDINMSISLDYGSDQGINRRWETVTEQFENRVSDLKGNSFFKTKYKPMTPESLYISPAGLTKITKDREVLIFSPMKVPVGLNVLDMGGLVGKNFVVERQERSNSLFKNLLVHIENKIKKGTVLIASYSEGSRDRMQTMLGDNGFHNHKKISDFLGLNHNPDIVGLVVLPIENGFESDELTIITEKDILGDRLVRPSLKKAKGKDFLKDLSTLKLNDLVIHIEHGLGKYVGLEKIETLGIEREYLSLQYSGNDKLLLPV